MKLFSRPTKILICLFVFLHASFSMASGPVGPAATATLNFGSSQTKPRFGLGLGLYSVEAPSESRMAPLVSLTLGGQRSNQQGVFASSTAQKTEESHTVLYVTSAVAIIAVGALFLTARHNAPSTQGSGGTNPPVQ